MSREIKNQQEQFAKSIEARADQLRTAAFEIDSIARRVRDVRDPERFRGWRGANNLSYQASLVQNEIVNLLPNLRLGTLTTEAYEIDKQAEDEAREGQA